MARRETRSKKRIAVVTGTRAEYGLLEPVMRAIDDHPGLRLLCVAAGMHLVTGTHRDIAFPIAAKVRMQKQGRVGRHHDAVATGRGLSAFAEAFAQLRPEVVVVLGDRVEAFAAASAASIAGSRVAHLHGGDRAEGVADEAMRHAISKLAHLHFPATAQSKRRLVRMGEHPERIFNHGSPAADGLSEIIAAEDGPELIVMHHPVGGDDATEYARMKALLAATRSCDRLVMSPNHDPGRRGIVRAIREAKAQAIDHLPRPEFLSKLKTAQAIVGNSSAGLIEAAIFKTPAVNIGSRQGGREKPSTVIDCGHSEREIRRAVKNVLSMDTRRRRHPYGCGDTGRRIAGTLAELHLVDVSTRKQNRY